VGAALHMKQVQAEVAETRAQTDASLGAERADTDSARSMRVARAQRALDDLIERDRIVADESLWKFRAIADRSLARERLASPSLDQAVTLERHQADEGKMAERKAMDAHVERERVRADDVVEGERRQQEIDRARQEARRQETDEQLVAERSGADATTVALGRTKEALADAQGEEARHRDVFGMVTHDLRNPLSVISLNAQNILATARDDGTREDAEEVIRAAARMERLLMDLLDVARIESRTLGVDKKTYDVGALMNELLRSYGPLFAARGMTFSIGMPVPAIAASFDHDRLVQVFSNLLGNAMKFTPADSTITLHVERRAGEIEFALRDSGPGIDPAALPHVFERFWQLERNTRRGLGLGLYICEKIVAAHGGRIWVESTPGHGATFRFTLPVG